jgi:hypothetical protein
MPGLDDLTHDVASAIEDLLAAIDAGTLTAPDGLVRGLEGAHVALLDLRADVTAGDAAAGLRAVLEGLRRAHVVGRAGDIAHLQGAVTALERRRHPMAECRPCDTRTSVSTSDFRAGSSSQ